MDAEDAELWAQERAAFFKPPTEGPLKRTRKKKIVKKRLSAWYYLRALDHKLATMLGFGLKGFESTADQADLPLQSRPLLTVHLDEGSPSYAMCWFLFIATRCRFLFIRDVFHREWNDIQNAVRTCKLWPTIVMTQLVLNLGHGPWQGGAWWGKLNKGLCCILPARAGGRPALRFVLWQ